ncbi:MAG: terminase large subunit [Oscillospiraceae bacterium]|nr:terminase large subunit [Oscillospiraceae bacterium]
MNRYIQDYINLVRSGVSPMCREQYQLADLIEYTFATENLVVDEDQLERYMGLLRYFPYKLLPWESFLFALHNCVYTQEGDLRWPCLVIVVGRGAGKNGYLAFEDFALLTPVNGIKNYNIDIFATAEDQARATFDDIYAILESNEAYFKKYFTWTKEEIVNKATGSKLKFRTAAPKTKDGGRPGKVDFDEVHAYENAKLIDVAVTGLGKKKHPRRTYITTLGDVRDGPLDKLMEKAKKVLSRLVPDNGWIYFICRLDSDAEIMQPETWGKANPSLNDPNRRELLKEILLEFDEYKDDPAGHSAFATKRMNRPQGDKEAEVTSWDNILAASAPLPDAGYLEQRSAVFGIDYASTQDFVAAGILIQADGNYYWITHSWVCAQSKTLSRINFPLAEAERRGELTMVYEPEISPDIPVQWVESMREKYRLIMGGIDQYRYTLLAKAFAQHGFDPDRKKGNLKLIYSPEQSRVAPIITSAFLNHKIIWGDNMLMRWYTNNAIRIIDRRGNITFGKIEPKSRKTDGFMALVAAFIVAEIKRDEMTYYNLDSGLPDLYVY